MRTKRWLPVIVSAALLTGVTVAHDHGHGKHDDDDDHHHYYSDHDRDEMHDWYHHSEGHLPPGLAKKDDLPPGLEKQLRVRGTLPPGLRKKMHPCPEEVERQLPPPPAGYENTVIGGHIVLVNRSTYMVLDIMHLEHP